MTEILEILMEQFGTLVWWYALAQVILMWASIAFTVAVIVFVIVDIFSEIFSKNA